MSGRSGQRDRVGLRRVDVVVQREPRSLCVGLGGGGGGSRGRQMSELSSVLPTRGAVGDALRARNGGREHRKNDALADGASVEQLAHVLLGAARHRQSINTSLRHLALHLGPREQLQFDRVDIVFVVSVDHEFACIDA